MRKKHLNAQIILISIGIILIFSTYLYYPYSKKNKSIKNQTTNEKTIIINENNQDSSFENVEYKGFYDLDKSFTVNAGKAHILKDDPELVYMSNMQVILYLADGRVVNILSNKGVYNKLTYDCLFEDNVRATDGDTKIFSSNLDLLGSENLVKIYNNVVINYPTGRLNADKVDYDFQTKYFTVSMFDSSAVKMKVFK